jgi:hypothetical protein
MRYIGAPFPFRFETRRILSDERFVGLTLFCLSAARSAALVGAAPLTVIPSQSRRGWSGRRSCRAQRSEESLFPLFNAKPLSCGCHPEPGRGVCERG